MLCWDDDLELYFFHFSTKLLTWLFLGMASLKLSSPLKEAKNREQLCSNSKMEVDVPWPCTTLTRSVLN